MNKQEKVSAACIGIMYGLCSSGLILSLTYIPDKFMTIVFSTLLVLPTVMLGYEFKKLGKKKK